VGVPSTYVPVAAVEELRPGFVSVYEVEGRGIVLARTDAGVTAWDATCPHAEFRFGPMRLRRGYELECPMHGARFDVTDGRVLKGPATEPLEPVTSRVEDGTVMVFVDWLL
jgi:nitrite reductase/ring-hydroxylating ferredoxin subunit